jgi:hypothetical protein
LGGFEKSKMACEGSRATSAQGYRPCA